MTITINSSIVPIAITVVLLIIMLRPVGGQGLEPLAILFRPLWLIPILAVWVIYLGIKLW